MSVDDRVKPERPIFCGNFEYDCEEHEVQTIFEKFGSVLKVDMKQGAVNSTRSGISAELVQSTSSRPTITDP